MTRLLGSGDRGGGFAGSIRGGSAGRGSWLVGWLVGILYLPARNKTTHAANTSSSTHSLTPSLHNIIIHGSSNSISKYVASSFL